jgi:hypothetical protein
MNTISRNKSPHVSNLDWTGVWQVVRRDGDQVDGKWMVDV